MMNRLGWALSGALAVVAILALARATVAGPLDPPGPVGSTMRTLDELVPSWGKTLSSSGGCSSQRFQCVMTADAAVLDRETGLVWARVPELPTQSWQDAVASCLTAATGGRYGWRLPSVPEITSLLVGSGTLPSDHPFTLSLDHYFWTTTTSEEDSRQIRTVGLFTASFSLSAQPRSVGASTWCVRGGGGESTDSVPPPTPTPSVTPIPGTPTATPSATPTVLLF